jgi:hypothetical protein
MITRAAIAAVLLVTGLTLGTGAATAAPAAPRMEAASAHTIEVDHRSHRPRQNYYRPRHGYSPYYHYYRPRHVCYTRFVVRYTYWGPQWVPVQSCYWR